MIHMYNDWLIMDFISWNTLSTWWLCDGWRGKWWLIQTYKLIWWGEILQTFCPRSMQQVDVDGDHVLYLCAVTFQCILNCWWHSETWCISTTKLIWYHIHLALCSEQSAHRQWQIYYCAYVMALVIYPSDQSLILTGVAARRHTQSQQSRQHMLSHAAYTAQS